MSKTGRKAEKKIEYEEVNQISDNDTSGGYSWQYSSSLQPINSSDKDNQIPINKVGVISYMFLSWLTPLVMKMFKNRKGHLDETDIWECSENEKCQSNTDRLETLWTRELKSKGKQKASFLWCWLTFCRMRLLASVILVTINALAAFFVSGFLLNKIVAYLESVQNNMLYGIGLAVAMLFANIVRTGTFCFVMVYGAQTGARFRAGYLGIAYRKLLRCKQLTGKGLAEVITIFGGDSYRVYMNCVLFQYILALPVYMIISIVYIYYLIGAWCFIGIAVFVVGYLIQVGLAKLCQIARRKTLIFTDKRVRKITEVLNNIKFIKMYAWEEAFQNEILEIRKGEKRYLMMSAILMSIGNAIIPVTPTLASVAAIASFTAYGYDISASKAFAVVGTLHFLRIIVIFMPYATRTLSEVRVSFERLKKLLVQEDFEPPAAACKYQDNAIEIDNGFFQWDAQDDASEKQDGSVPKEGFRINAINFTVPKGKLIGMCGPVGAGKSSLLTAILGRMKRVSGNLAVNGSIAYSSQQAWIFNETLRENILFGRSFNEYRFRNVIQDCGLKPDHATMENGDETEIGENGINLSGGQKQRVSLARAVYSDSDIYLLDDPLSAVDVHVGQHLFHECIRNRLAGKTIVLVTHQLQYLQYCDEIVVLDKGQITEKGHHNDLIQKDGFYKDMIEKFHQKKPIADDHASKSERDEPVTENNLDKNINPSDVKSKSDVSSTSADKTESKGKNHASKSEREDHVTENKLEKNINPSDGKSKYDVSSPSADKSESKGKGTRCVITYSQRYTMKYRRILQQEGRITEQEDMEQGNVRFSTYMSYINAAGGVFLCLFVALLYVVATGSVVFSDWWLGIWINSFKKDSLTKEINITVDKNNTISTAHAMVSNVTSTDEPFLEQDAGRDVFLLVYVASLGGIILFTIIRGFAGAAIMMHAAVQLHKRVLKNVLKATMSFFDANPSGRILNRFSKDMDEVDAQLPSMIDSLLQLLNTVVLSVLSTAVVLPWILIALVPVAVMFVLLKNVSSVSVRQMKRISNVAFSPLMGHIKTTAQGLSTIASFNQQRQFENRSDKMVDDTTTAVFLFDASMRWIGLRLDLTSAVIIVVTSFILVTTKGTVSPALAALSLSMCLKVVGNMQVMIRNLNEMEARFTSVERLHHYEKSIDIEPGSFKLQPDNDWPSQGKIVFSKAQMKYHSNMKLVLKDISFDIPSKTKIGIVGRTGAGKSSLATILFRLVELCEGRIEIDGVDISQLQLQTLRSRLTIIPQDPVLFAGTLRYNLDPFGKHTENELWKSLEYVHIKQKISQLGDSLQCEIKENGENFSVGERQLICLARAILNNNKIIVLDEATASVDTQTDSLIQQTIAETFCDCTVLTIAHRLNTIQHSDLIVILDNGEIIEIGSPEKLKADPKSHFSEMLTAHSSFELS